MNVWKRPPFVQTCAVLVLVYLATQVAILLNRKRQAVLELDEKIEKYNIIIADAIRSNQKWAKAGNLRHVEDDTKSLTLFRERARHIQDKCHAISDGVLEEYSSFYFIGDNYEDNYRYRRETEFTPLGDTDPRASVYHNGFREHGPTAVVPAYNFLVSVPEKCGSEFWFRIAEYLNFPQSTWPKNAPDKKKYQRMFMLSMINSLPMVPASLEENGTTVAIVRHPFLRLYSAWRGFFTANAIKRDYNFATFWLKNSDAFAVLMSRHEDIAQALADSEYDQAPQIDLMRFDQFVEGIVIHAERTVDYKGELRWTEQGDSHINPLFAILMPCQYKYKYYLKVENMANEARQFLDTLNIKLPESYLRPSHKSGKNRVKIEDKVKRVYSKINRDHIVQLKLFYQLDFDFFGYGLNVETLEITY